MRSAALIFALMTIPAPAEPIELRGHGGPVRALAVSPEETALTGSFDARTILWDLSDETAERVSRLHEGSVNAVAFLPHGQVASAGESGEIVVWDEAGVPIRLLAAHSGPIVALALSPDGSAVASASWDGTARITRLDDADPTLIVGHAGNVNAVVWLDPHRVATAGYDGTLRFWTDAGAPGPMVRLATPLNALAIDGAERLWAAGADGLLRAFDRSLKTVQDIALGEMPLISLAVSPDGATLAAGAIDGALFILDSNGRITTRIVTGAAVWALAFDPSGTEILATGPDNVVRSWSASTGDLLAPPPNAASEPALDGSRGAEVFRACTACHTLGADDGHRAGPTLHALFGRRIASVPGYDYSTALERLDIIWTPDTVAELFEVGPSRYTPGTKMPEQIIGGADDRGALVEFLERATR